MKIKVDRYLYSSKLGRGSVGNETWLAVGCLFASFLSTWDWSLELGIPIGLFIHSFRKFRDLPTLSGYHDLVRLRA